MKRLLLAFQFLVQVPIPLKEATERDIGRSAIFFPLVGACIGGMLVVAYLLLELLFPVMVARVLTLVVMIFLYGAFHLDGLSDTADGLYGGKDCDDTLRIMKDSHVGAMGVIAIVTIIAVKATALVALSEPVFRGALLVMPILGHGSMVIAMAFPYSRPSGLGKTFVDHRLPIDGWVAGICLIGSAFGILKFAGLLALVGALAAAGALLALVWRRIQGITGDVLGAVNEVVEVSFLVLLTATSRVSYG